jgi:hypothetical protein
MTPIKRRTFLTAALGVAGSPLLAALREVSGKP